MPTNVLTYLTYSKVFRDNSRGIILPLSYLKDKTQVVRLINDLIKDFDCKDAICHSSFMNAIIQTCGSENIEKIGLAEANKIDLSPYLPTKGILFHRDNLLYLIGTILNKKDGKLKITGQKTYSNVQDYCKCLLLTNEIIPSGSIEQNILIREYPYYYALPSAMIIYELRIKRYQYIYTHLIKALKDTDKEIIKPAIATLERASGISLQKYFHAICLLYLWFFRLPSTRPKNKDIKTDTGGFDYNNIDSFYIREENFGEDHILIRLCNYLSLSLEGYKEKIASIKRKYSIDEFYKIIQIVFDYPIFKIDEKNFCILDLKFLIQGLCSGFIRQVNKLFNEDDRHKILSAQGHLLELYFVELLQKIFNKKNIHKSQAPGSPDAILETQSHILLFEFTREHYRIPSLYGDKIMLEEDLHSLLFNLGQGDSRGRGKKDKGKFFKLNNYVKKQQPSSKCIIPILITENYLGDFDLIDRFDNLLSKGISMNKLDYIKTNKPIILNLDDLELFRQSAGPNPVDQFIECLEKREAEKSNKRLYHFNFSYFATQYFKDMKVNPNFHHFFNFQKFMEQFMKRANKAKDYGGP